MTIRTGIGGWTYSDWRGGAFYPAGLRQADEQAYATRAVQVIEVNGTFYRRQKPETFIAWRNIAPPGFVYALKGSRFVTNRKVLGTAGESVASYLNQGLVELGDMLGPIVWQLAATKRFDPDDLAAFFALLPRKHQGVKLSHAIEIGHESFACREFVDSARRSGIAIVFNDAPDRPAIADRTAGFIYMRLKGMRPDCLTGYPKGELDRWANVCRAWDAGEAPDDLNYCGNQLDSSGLAGDVFAMMINGAKERAPAAAIALAAQLGDKR
jgi:uncharacterized protein YecE (DUF72 family)